MIGLTLRKQQAREDQLLTRALEVCDHRVVVCQRISPALRGGQIAHGQLQTRL